MKRKKVIALSSAFMIGTTTAFAGSPASVIAQENPEIVQEVIGGEGETEQTINEKQEVLEETQDGIIEEKEIEQPIDEKQEVPEEVQDGIKEENKIEQSMAEKGALEDISEEKNKVEQNEGSIAIDEAHFPDPLFREYLKNTWDENKDGMFSDSELKKILEVRLIKNQAVKSLQGIEYFPNLKVLDCNNTGVTSLDVSHNQKLKSLSCGACGNLKEVNVSNNPNLEEIISNYTNLTNIDISSCVRLYSLQLQGNKLTELDVTHNPELSNLLCENNQISELDVSGNSKLKMLYCQDNKLKTLDISHNPMLKWLDCGKNNISKLDVQNNLILEEMGCYMNPIQELDVSKNLNLESLQCFKTEITGLDVSKNVNLKELKYNNGISFYPTWLNIGDHPVLEKDHCFIGSTQRTIKITGKTFNLRDNTDKKIDLSKVDIVSNGKLDAKTGIVTVMDTSKPVVYEYDCGTAKGEKLTLTVEFQLKTTESDNTAPEIFASDISLNVGDEFDPLENATATDKEDGTITLTKDNIIANDVDTSVAGTYHVTYRVTDKNGVSSEKTIKVTVNENMSIINTIPTISANDVNLNLGDRYDPLENVTATDKEDGAITLTKDNIISNDVDTSKVGIYHVTFRVVDKNGAIAEKTIKVTVKAKDKNKPVKPKQPQKPKSNSRNPKTGDMSNIGVFTSMFAGSAGALTILFGKRRKKK